MYLCHSQHIRHRIFFFFLTAGQIIPIGTPDKLCWNKWYVRRVRLLFSILDFEWSSRRFWGASECKRRWGSCVTRMKDLQESLPPPQIPKERDLSLSSLTLSSPLGSHFSIPTERPQKAGFPGYLGDFNPLGPPFDGSRYSLREGKEKPSSAQTLCNRVSAALPGPDASKPPSPASSSI